MRTALRGGCVGFLWVMRLRFEDGKPVKFEPFIEEFYRAEEEG